MVQMGTRAEADDLAESIASGGPLWRRSAAKSSSRTRSAYCWVGRRWPRLSGMKLRAVPPRSRWSRRRGGPGASMPARSPRSGNRRSYLDAGTAQQVAAEAVDEGAAPGGTEPVRSCASGCAAGSSPPNPDAAEDRRERANGDRRVVVTPGDGGTSRAVGAAAQDPRPANPTSPDHGGAGAGADDARSTDQRRADALVDLVPGQAEPARGAGAGDRVRRDLGRSRRPARLGTRPRNGHRPGTARTSSLAERTARAGQVRVRRLLTDPVTGTLTDLTELERRATGHQLLWTGRCGRET